MWYINKVIDLLSYCTALTCLGKDRVRSAIGNGHTLTSWYFLMVLVCIEVNEVEDELCLKSVVWGNIDREPCLRHNKDNILSITLAHNLKDS